MRAKSAGYRWRIIRATGRKAIPDKAVMVRVGLP